MDKGSREELGALFERALELPAREREQFLQACSDDPALQSELRSLLAAHDRAPNLLEYVAREVMPAALHAVADDGSFADRAADRGQPLMTMSVARGGAALQIVPGSQFGQYEIQHIVATGGMGIVYRAIDTVLQRPVALKMLQLTSPDAHESLLREARAASALNHPHICTIYEVGQHGECPFIAMEYVDGRQLGELIPKDGLPAESVVRLGVQVAQAIEYAHRHHVIHGDLKSANVLVSEEGRATVLDFGLASRLAPVDADTLTRTSSVETSSGALAGTLPYMSPELLRGGVADTASDVWALGVLLYEMAAGRLPFQGATPFELTAAILDESPHGLRPKTPPGLRSVIGKCLERDSTHRYRDAGEVRVALETLRGGTDLSSAGDGRSTVTIIPWWRPRSVVGGVLAVIAVAATTMFVRDTRAPALTERDRLLVADFINTTGDSVFDGTLKQALSINLEQSPFLSVVSREEVRAMLGLMTKSPDDRVAGDVARDACQRLEAKAMIEGSIAPVGSHYTIGLTALNCQSGATIASDQAEVTGQEEVLKGLGAAASRLRRSLGESLPTIQRFDTPIEQATTPSLEALKMFNAGEDVRARSSEYGSIPFFTRAIELDPNFAMSYARLASIYANLGQGTEQRRNIEEAYARRERVSERERFYIEGMHCGFSTDPDSCVNVYELWKRTYPRDGRPHGNLSGVYYGRDECEKARANAADAVRLDPAVSQPYAYLARSLLCLGRSAEARQILDQATVRHLDSPFLYLVRFHLGFFERDDRAMATVRRWAMGQPEESLLTEADSEAAAFDGQMQRSRALRMRAEQLAADRLKERVLAIRARGAVYEAVQGDVARARAIIDSIATTSPAASTRPFLAVAAVISHDDQSADELFKQDEALPGQPRLLSPLLGILRDVDSGNVRAMTRMPVASGRDIGGGLAFQFIYLRGLIYLHAGDGASAVKEFQRILDRRGRAATSPFYPLAYAQQARAFALMSEPVKARHAYEEFFALWKNADSDIPILRNARQEYARLQPGIGTKND
jgi:serine/threonine protein kinase/tetratricopeptide (TPR) repeat protein